MGVRAHFDVVSSSWGTVGCFSGLSDHQLRSAVAGGFIENFVGHSAPVAIQLRIAAISSAVSGSASFGISALPSEGVIRSSKKLSSGLPGVIAAPLSPPFIIVFAVASEKPPLR